MSKIIFVSCVFEDGPRIWNIVKWAEQKRLGDVIITCETEDKRDLGFDAIKAHLKNKIEASSALLVLVGQDTHNHEWVRAEVELANSFHKNILCVRIPDSKGLITTGAVPTILSRYKLVNFDPESIKKAIETP